MENMKRDIKHTFYALLIAGMIGGVSACGNESKDTDTSSSTNTGKAYNDGIDAGTANNDAETVESNENAWMLERDQYVATHRETLNKVDTKLSDAEKAMEKMGSKSKSAMKESINSLKLKRDQFEDKLSNIEQAGQSDWAAMKKEVDEKATELDLTHKSFDKEYGMNNK